MLFLLPSCFVILNRAVSCASGGGGVIVMEPVLRQLRDTAKEPTPDSIVVFPLFSKPIFPGTLTTTIVQDEGKAVRDCAVVCCSGECVKLCVLGLLLSFQQNP